MNPLVLQITLQQWDKSQQSAEHVAARQQLPNRHSIESANVAELFNGRVLLDQHGDNHTVNRIRYQLVDDRFLLIDRFRFDLQKQTVEFKAKLESNVEPVLLATIEQGWIQCRYQWRYRVDESGFIFWRYETVTINAAFVEQLNSQLFLHSPPIQSFPNLV
ncbi:hypothetical protein MPL1_12983 [Methylophaga lonarensis MPL]|uniref:Uncharacterized protein n=1 Tax=Methylophaga lonarensis MPL TaxID=1286106 RepID=M7NXL5_9GAMM|nr:hypothetical protein [Methylophaga lonarensis]EMR11926.1 hypothetical protein MPL1_12983 [Methylophaga lonarensis MPL]